MADISKIRSFARNVLAANKHMGKTASPNHPHTKGLVFTPNGKQAIRPIDTSDAGYGGETVADGEGGDANPGIASKKAVPPMKMQTLVKVAEETERERLVRLRSFLYKNKLGGLGNERTDLQNVLERSDKGTNMRESTMDKNHPAVKQAVGIAFDKRYKDGNMAGALEAIRKVGKKHGAENLEDHPMVKGALERAMTESAAKYIEEKLTASNPASDWIHDFVHSDNPMFAGKSKAERIKMALGAKQAADHAVKEDVELDEMDKSQPSSSRGAEGLPTGTKADPVKTDKVRSDALKLLQKSYKKEEVAIVAEGGFFDPDQPKIGDRVKHINGTTGEVKKIGTQDKTTTVYFKNDHPEKGMPGEMNSGEWRKHVSPEKISPAKKIGVAEGSSDDIEDTKSKLQFGNAIALAKAQKAIRQARDGKDAKYYSDGARVTPDEVARRAAERKAKKQGVAENTGVTDYNPKSEGGTRKELLDMYAKSKDPKHAEQARRAGASQSELTAAHQAPMSENTDPREYGYEGDMAMSQLKSVIRNAKELHDLMEPQTDLPEWLQSKITLASDYIQTASDYWKSEKQKTMQEEVWDNPMPSSKKQGKLSSEQVAMAKARATRAGRKYPNMIDNMWASKQ